MTALPDGVTFKTEGTLRFVSERGYWTPPFTSCMFASLDSVLEWMGLNTPLPTDKTNTPPENFVLTMHKASGASLKSGTTIHDTKVALQALLPDVPVKFATGTADDVIGLVNNGAACRVIVNHCDTLPKYLRRFVGYGYSGGHALAVMGARMNNGVQEVLWFDPMARPVATWQGEWVKWSDVVPSISDNSGNITVTFGYKSEAIPAPVQPPVAPPITDGGSGDTEVILSNVVERQRGVVAAVTPVLHPETQVQILTVAAGALVKLVGVSPDGKFRGILVNSSKIVGTNPKVALIDANAVSNLTVDDPTQALQTQLDDANAHIAADKQDAQTIVAR